MLSWRTRLPTFVSQRVFYQGWPRGEKIAIFTKVNTRTRSSFRVPNISIHCSINTTVVLWQTFVYFNSLVQLATQINVTRTSSPCKQYGHANTSFLFGFSIPFIVFARLFSLLPTTAAVVVTRIQGHTVSALVFPPHVSSCLAISSRENTSALSSTTLLLIGTLRSSWVRFFF